MKTQSNVYPKISRSKREQMIFFPENIQKIKREDIDGKAEEIYEYNLIKIPDAGQQIEDYELFKKENYAELRKQAYGDWRSQFEIMQEQGFRKWVDYCQTVKSRYPKKMKITIG